MTDILDEAHARVALDLLEANATLDGRVHDGVVPDPMPDPDDGWVLVYTTVTWTAAADAAGSSLGHDSDTCVTTWTIHCVGSTAAACRALAMQVRESLLDAQGTVAGRECFRIVFEDAQAPFKDESLGVPVMDAVVTYSMTSVPG